MSVAMLWRERSRPRIGSLEWLRAWAQRGRSLPTLLRSELRRSALRARGASCGPLTVFGQLKIEGQYESLSIGEHTALGNVEIVLHAPVRIGSRVVINDNCRLLTATHDTRDPAWRTVARPIVIEDYAWIATDALILPGVRVGRGAVVGAGAVARVDVQPYSIVVGNPAAPTSRTRPQSLSYDPVRLVSYVQAWLGRPPQAAVAPAHEEHKS
jgi:acetyltransferase-like isoleucine patch superfamily enzyme